MKKIAHNRSESEIAGLLPAFASSHALQLLTFSPSNAIEVTVPNKNSSYRKGQIPPGLQTFAIHSDKFQTLIRAHIRVSTLFSLADPMQFLLVEFRDPMNLYGPIFFFFYVADHITHSPIRCRILTKCS